MGGLSIWHWLIVLIVVMLLFGTGKVSNLMGDFAKGIKSFKKHMNEDDSAEAANVERPIGSIAATPTAPQANTHAPQANTYVPPATTYAPPATGHAPQPAPPPSAAYVPSATAPGGNANRG